MILREAFNKVKKMYPDQILINAIDLGDEWGFIFSDRELNIGEELIGGAYDVVNKKTGQLSKIPVNITTFNKLASGRRLDTRLLK